MTIRTAPGAPRAVLLAVVVVTAALPARAQEPDYPLLVNRFGELCTMCEATVACSAGAAPPAEVAELAAPGADWTLYHFQTKDFWGQVATIFKYLERWIRPVVREERPVVIHTARAGSPVVTVAALGLDPPVIEVGERRIDRTTNAWQSLAGEPVGSCARLPLRETLAYLKAGPAGATAGTTARR